MCIRKHLNMEGRRDVYLWGKRVVGEGEGESVQPLLLNLQISIQAISCGYSHSAFLTHTGLVYTLGDNQDGQLGLGLHSAASVTQPNIVPGLPCILAVSCGYTHTLAVTDAGLVYSWGSGALGNGRVEAQWSPVLISLPANYTATSVSSGFNHSAILGNSSDEQGKLLVFGSGEQGQLGTGKYAQELFPVPILQSDVYCQVACGWLFTLVIAGNGTVLSCGANDKGQLGTRRYAQSAVFTPIAGLSAITKLVAGHYATAISQAGQAYIWGSSPLGESLVPVPIPLPRSIIDISIGPGFGLAVDSTGQVWAWGSNTAGQLGLGDYANRTVPHAVQGVGKVKTVNCGGNWTFATAGNEACEVENSWDSTEAGLSSSARDKENTSLERILKRFEAPDDTIPSRDHIHFSSLPATLSLTDESAASRMLIRSLRCELTRRSAEVNSLQSIIDICRSELDQKCKEVREITQLLELRAQEIEDQKNSESQRNVQLETALERLTAAQSALLTANNENSRLKTDLEVAKLTGKQETESLNSHIAELQAQLSRSRKDHQILYEAWSRTEAHNRSLLHSLEEKSLQRAQDYRTRTQPYLSRPPLQALDSNSDV